MNSFARVLLLVPFVLADTVPDSWAETFVDAAVGYEYDDNLTRAEHRDDIESDDALRSEFDVGKFVQVTDRLSLSAALTGEYDKYAEFEGLDRYALGGSLGLRTKFGLGSQAPWLRIGMDAAHVDVDHDARDGWRWRLGLSAGRRFGERLELVAHYDVDRFRADDVVDNVFLVQNFGLHGDAFDTDGQSWGLGGHFEVTPWLAISFDYTRRDGDVTSTTRRNEEIFEESEAIAPDPVFGPDRFAYRIPADTDFFSVTASLALGDHASLSVGYMYVDSNYEELHYGANQARAQIRFSY